MGIRHANGVVKHTAQHTTLYHLKQVEHGGKQGLHVTLEVVVGRQAVDELQNELAQLLSRTVDCELGLA